MEPIAENTTVVTKPMFYEAMAAVDNYRETVLKGIGFLAVAWVALVAVTLYMGMSLGFAFMELFVLSAVGCWLLFFLPRSRYRRGFQAMENRYGGNLERKICFYREYLTIETSQNTAEFRYHDILRIRKTKNLLVLLTFDKTGLFFDLTGFTKGDADTVKHAVEAIIR